MLVPGRGRALWRQNPRPSPTSEADLPFRGRTLPPLEADPPFGGRPPFQRQTTLWRQSSPCEQTKASENITFPYGPKKMPHKTISTNGLTNVEI